MSQKTKPRQKPKLYITWDTETYQTKEDEETIIKPYLVGWYCENKFYYSFHPHKDFFNFLEEKNKEYKLILIAHNANYDLPVIIKDYLSKFDGIKCEYKVSSQKKFISFKFRSTAPKIVFSCLDTLVWNSHIKALNSWLKIIGKPLKHENFFYDKWDLTQDDEFFYFHDSEGIKNKSKISDELRYLERDCQGTWEVFEYQEKSRDYLYDITKTNKPMYTKKTSPSFVKSLIDEKYGFKFFDNTFRPSIPATDEGFKTYKSMIESSCGGFTCCSLDNLEFVSSGELIQSFDSNSHYPHIMYHGLPSGHLLEEPPKDKEYITFYEIFLTECNWVEKYSFLKTKPLPSKWMVQKHSHYLVKEYYDVIKNHMITDLKIIKTWYAVKNYQITPFIKDLYKEKLRIDKMEASDIKTFRKINIKIILNSIYGKLCEQTYLKDCKYNIKKMRFEELPAEVKEFRSPMAGVYVAHIGRAVLIRNILKEVENGNTFLYSDTDSIKLVLNNPVSLNVHSNKLGAWKCEGCGEDGKKGYTHFHSPGKTKKWLLYNKNDPESLKFAYSGGTAIIYGISKFGGYDLVKNLFDSKKNVLIRGGKTTPNKKNIFGQSLIESSDLSSNGNKDTATHEIFLCKKTNSFIFRKI